MILNKEKVISNLANKGVIEYLNENKYKKNLEFIDDISLMKNRHEELNTHPDVVELLWNDYSKKLPVKCQMILFGTPVLINPTNGIIFGIAEGTNPPLLRLPSNQIPIIIKKGGKITLSDIDGVYADASVLGDEWVYCFSFIKNIDEYCLLAYDHSGIVR